MVNKRWLEIVVGLFVAVGLAALVMLAMKVSNLATVSRESGYDLIARFDNVGGLKVRSPVTLAGVRVGQIAAIDIDKVTYQAVVTINVSNRYELPLDTHAAVLTSGLLGEQYVGLEPGGDEAYLQPGDEIKMTQSALVLEQVLGQFIYSRAAGNTGNE